MFVRAKIVKQIPYFYIVESQRAAGTPTPRQSTKHYLGNYQTAIANLPALDLSQEDRQKFMARINKLEADAQARIAGKPKGKRGRPKKVAKSVGDHILTIGGTP